MKNAEATHVNLNDALSKGPPPHGNLAVPIFSHGSLVMELYTPVGHDPQKPHTRDEMYFVARGKGWFFDGKDRLAVEPGSFLFVPAGQVHRFEDFNGLCGMGGVLRAGGRRIQLSRVFFGNYAHALFLEI